MSTYDSGSDGLESTSLEAETPKTRGASEVPYALAYAARRRNPEIRMRIRQGKLDLNGLLAMLAFTPEIGGMSLQKAIGALPGVSPKRAKRIIETVGLSPTAKLSALVTPKGEIAFGKIQLMLYPEKRRQQAKMKTVMKAPHERWPWAGDVNLEVIG